MVFAGLYGVLTQLVSYRRREIGVRIALGATRQSVAQLILRQGSILVGAGLGVGLTLALATGRLVKSFLYQVQPLECVDLCGRGSGTFGHRIDGGPDPCVQSGRD